MSDLTPVTEEVTPPSASTTEPSSTEPTETVEEIKARLTAAENETKRWKNRVAEENPPKDKRKVDPDEAYADWRIDNKERISLVKEKYETELSELQEGGMKPSIAMREKALKLAEASEGVKHVESSEPLPGPSIQRSGQKEPKMTPQDIQFGIKPETIKKYAHIVEAD